MSPNFCLLSPDSYKPMVIKRPTYSGMRAAVVVAALALLAGVPFSDSPDFFLDTTMIPFDLSFAESADFAMDTFIAFRMPHPADSPEFGLHLGGVNRVWGDSESFALDVPPRTGTLAVSPSGDFESAGNQWGPFVPGSRTYTLRNVGEEPITWTATTLEPWVDLFPSGGTLGAGGVAYVTVYIDPLEAMSLLLPGTYVDWVFFTNTTNGLGTQTREVVLTVYVVQPAPGQDTDRERISLDHLWQWSDSAGRFVDPGSAGVTIDPNKPTYLLTHGWDGSLDGRNCGNMAPDGTCATLDSPDDNPDFGMSSCATKLGKGGRDGIAETFRWNPAGCRPVR